MRLTHFGVLVAVGFPQVGRHWVDHHQGNISDLGDLHFEKVKIVLQIECAPASIDVAYCGYDVHAPKSGAGRH